ncbi:OmpA family protein [Actinoplanes sp. NPDC049802]|uniref:OmpA family protein n=1 Tax=Actinoplanes sp. NPDC049802 TaxID=3154742 RepID=UPI0033FA9255
MTGAITGAFTDEVTRRWFAALALLFSLTAIVGYQLGPNRDRIEDDLAARSAAALTAAGATGAQVSYSGRDATVVTGSRAEADRARQVLATVNGVRAVHTEVVPAALQVAPDLRLVVEDGRVTLSGRVATAGTRQALHDAAASGFATVDDRITVAAGVAADPMIDRLPALLRALPADGSLRFENATLTLTGTARDEIARAELTTAARDTGATVLDRLTVTDPQRRLDGLPPLTFRTGGSGLTGESAAALREVATVLRRNPSARLHVEGHTDARGSAATNLALSEKRAAAVRDVLRDLGIAAQRLTITGYGEARPAVPDDTAAHRAQNRRVELRVESPWSG